VQQERLTAAMHEFLDDDSDEDFEDEEVVE
jgi:hypothetical protein